MKLRIGLIGLGPNWASRHKPALRALSSRYEVRAVCDPVSHLAEQAASEFRARTMEGFRALIASEDIDAVLLLSARWFGALPIDAACDYGKAVYCGASVDLDAHQAAHLRDRVAEAGIAFMAEFPKRLAPATIRLQELMATRLGRPKLMFCNERLHARRADRVQGGGESPMRHLVEMVDWCRYIVDREVVSVHGAAHPAAGREDGEDYSLMSLEFAPLDEGAERSGAFAQIACGSYVPPEWAEAVSFRRPADMQVICEHGVAFVDLPSTLVWFDRAGQHTESLDSERPVGEQLLAHFHRAVESLVLKTSGLEDAYRAMSIVIAARQSNAEGRRVRFDGSPC